MKKRILICHWNMVIGGIETALINLLKRIDHNQFEVDLLLEDKHGEFLEFIPSYVNVFDSASIGLLHGGTKKALIHELKTFKLISAMKVLYYWRKKDLRRFDCFYKKIPKLKYDVAISYSMHSLGLMKLVNDYVEAPIKLLFVHNEPILGGPYPGTIIMDERINCVDKYNYICGVSGSITEKFARLFPQYSDRCKTVYNFMDVVKFKKDSENTITEMKTDKIKILSVGRFEDQKNFKVIPSVCEHLLRSGIDFNWYIVGDGSEREYTQKLVNEKNLQDRLFLLGARINPYPYYKACDIYCQTSVSEAYCTTVNEARIFNKPIVSTMFPGITEQLSNGQGGVIVERTSEAIADGIIKIVQMKDKEKKEMLLKATYPNELEMVAENRFFEYIGQKSF